MGTSFSDTTLTISIDGKTLSTYKSFFLHERTGDHDTFELHLDLETGDNKFRHDLGTGANWLGKQISANETLSGSPLFLGVVTAVSMQRENDAFGFLLVQGYSTTYRLENAPSCRSWTERTLADIVREITKDADVEADIHPEYSGTLTYECQYMESDFDFLRRLAKQYGEWFYYNGVRLVFGRPESSADPIKLEFGRNLRGFGIGVKTLARPFEISSYYSESDYTFTESSSNDASGQDVLGHKAFKASMEMFRRPSIQHALPRIKNTDNLARYAKNHQNGIAAQSHTIKGSSDVMGLKVGSTIEVSSSLSIKKDGVFTPAEFLGTFLIIEISHSISENSYYANSFVAIPGYIHTLPEPDVALPMAETQMAVVTSNDDPMGLGRVQVQMVWQKAMGTHSSWLRVMTPDGGSSDGVQTNRGFVFIPEVGDQVLVGFRYNDPNRPFVMGSLFNGNTGKGGGKANSIKSITTRSGISITLNDDNKSLDIKDAGGSSVHLDGNGNITLNAPKDIRLNAGNDMSFTAGHNLTVNVGNSQTSNIGNMQLTNVMQKILVNTPFMQQLVSEFFHTQAGKALLNSQNQIKIEAPETNVVGEQELLMHSANKTVVNSQGTMEMRGEQGMNETNVAKEYETAKKELDCDTVVFFQPTADYSGTFGFDWYRMGTSGIRGDFAFEKKEKVLLNNEEKIKDEGIIGRHYRLKEVTKNGKKKEEKQTSGDYRDSFETLPASVQRQRSFYERWNVSWLKPKSEVKDGAVSGNTPKKATEDEKDYEHTYFVPLMTIMKDAANVKLATKILFNPDKKDRPKEIKLEFTRPVDGLTVTPSVLPIGGEGTNITLACTKEFDTETFLVAKADDKVCGKIKILPNSKNYQRDLKMVVVFVKTKLDPIEGNKTGEIALGGIDLFRVVMKQALITIPKEVPSIKLNCTEEAFAKLFSKDYNKQKGHDPDISIIYEKHHSMKTYLEKKLTKMYGMKYADYYKLFIFPDPCYMTENNIDYGLNGYGYLDDKHACFFLGHEDGTIAHEMCHCLGLGHTFDYTDPSRTVVAYQYAKTTNMLDYSHLQKIKRNSLFYWQWKKINRKLNKV